MTDRLYLIIAEGLSSERREVCHEMIKDRTSDWWHQMPDVWIVRGFTSAAWRDLLTPVIRGTGASIIVFRLPEEPGGWAYFGIKAKERLAWLHEKYSLGSKLE